MHITLFLTDLTTSVITYLHIAMLLYTCNHLYNYQPHGNNYECMHACILYQTKTAWGCKKGRC